MRHISGEDRRGRFALELGNVVGLDKIRLFNEVNVQLGYEPLSILSPREVTTYEGS